MKSTNNYIRGMVGSLIAIPGIFAFLSVWLELFFQEAFNGHSTLFLLSFAVFAVITLVVKFAPKVEGNTFIKNFNAVTERTICYCLGFTMILYGLSKIFRAQFFFSLSTADTALREIPSTALTWYYFGQSFPYTVLIAISQIAGGLLLFFRKTSLLGALILFPIIINIVALNYFYDLWSTTKVLSVVLLLMTVFILVYHYKRLLPIISALSSQERTLKFRASLSLKLIVIATFISFSAWDLYNTSKPYNITTPVYGSYRTVGLKHGDNQINIQNLENIFWRKIYFDKAFNGSVRRSDDILVPVKYSAGPEGSLKITFAELHNNDFSGTYKRSGNTLVIKGFVDNVAVTYTLEKL